jgi:pimeloyl-ACP methyl ester carboxylesterase
MRTENLLVPALVALAGCASVGARPALERRALAPDGVEIAYEEHGTGEPALVLVHCWAGDRSFWREQVPEFARERRVIALDLAGHGASGAREEWSLEALGRDVVAVLDDASVERCVLVGHSLGGPVSLAAAPRSGGRVLAVVGVETLHDVELRVPQDQLEAFYAALAADFPGTMAAAVRSMLPRSTPDELVRWIAGKAAASRPEHVIPISRAAVAADPKALLAAAGVPVRCLNSAPTLPSVPPTALERNRAVADYDAVLIEGTGHYPQLERPREFGRVLREVLARLGA